MQQPGDASNQDANANQPGQASGKAEANGATANKDGSIVIDKTNRATFIKLKMEEGLG